MVGGVRCVVRDASQAYADARMWCLWSPLSKLVFWPYQTGPYDEPFDEPYLNLSSKKPSTLSQYLKEEEEEEEERSVRKSGARRRCGACALYQSHQPNHSFPMPAAS